MAAAELLKITLVPVMMGYIINNKIIPEHKNPINVFLIKIYHPVIEFVLRFKVWAILIAVFILLATIFPYSRIGSEFMPPLNEGDLLYMPTTDPGISITKARELLQQTDKIIKSFPEVEHVFGKIGRAETATDPAPLSMIETTITLKPKDRWRPGMTMKKLVNALDSAIQFPGLTNAWTMPIKTRIDMLSTGIKTPVGVKILGSDLTVLSKLGQQISQVLRQVPGTVSVFSDKTVGGNYLDFEINREVIGRYGLTVGDVQDVIMSTIGGMNVTHTVEGLARYPVNVRYNRDFRENLPALQQILISTPSGAQIPISEVANIRIHKGPPMIKSENSKRTAWLYVDIRGVDVGSYVKKARRIVEEKIGFPAGYSIVWSGQFEYMKRAEARLKIVIPIALVIIFLLLYLNFRNVIESLIIMLSLPFAIAGGVWFTYILGYNMSVAVGIGFIALAGVAAETGVIMLIYLDQAYNQRKVLGNMNVPGDLHSAIVDGAVKRVRPKMMTVSAIIFGLLPILWGTGAGSQVMKRIAAPMVGGMITSTLLTLFVIPVLYEYWKRREMKNSSR